MSDITTLKVQRETRPKIEDIIPFVVADDKQQTALDFVKWLRESQMAPGWSGVHNAWDAKCRSKTICKISLIDKNWANSGHIRGKYSWEVKLYCPHIFWEKYGEDIVIAEGLQEILWNNIYKCTHACLDAAKPCIGGGTQMLYGKKFKKVCPSSMWPILYDPDDVTLNSVKRLLELEKQARVTK
ncbi:MAG: hypothetical protein FWE06_06110 [Oscillospiraceae bacterium]|nr:hypothetical protein [Oscillospiraceae bacterium]